MDRISIAILVAFAAVVVCVGVCTRSGDEGSVPAAEVAFDRPATDDELTALAAGHARLGQILTFDIGPDVVREPTDPGPGDSKFRFMLNVTDTEKVRFEKLPWVVGGESEKFMVVIWECDEALQSCEALREWSTCAGVCSEAWAEGE